MGRPEDMLMFIGKYLKKNLIEVDKVKRNKSKDMNAGKLDKFFITYDLLNSLGTAIKLYIDNIRQELRFSIALWRKPLFHQNFVRPDANKKNKRHQDDGLSGTKIKKVE